MRLWLDLETFSDVPIDRGVYRYAEKARILLCAYAIDNAPARCIDCAAMEPMPADFTAAIRNPDCEIWAHNANFDRVILMHYPGCEAAARDIPRWRDSMILAHALSLPGRLYDLCELCRLPADRAKDKDGHRLVLMFSRPRPDGAVNNQQTHPADWARFKEYCRLDVEAMRAVAYKLPADLIPGWLWSEWHIDQRVNDRGMYIDMPLVRAAVAASKNAIENADLTVQRLTGGKVSSVGQLDGMLSFIMKEYGYSLPDMQRATLEARLNDSAIPEPARELLYARLAASKASVKKFQVLESCTGPDGRLRGCLQFIGAVRTGRWTGRLFQPQNLPRGTMSPDDAEMAISALKSGVAEYVYDDINSVVSNCVRGAICAPAGKKLVVADLSNIEGRVLSWLAGENWKLDAFRAYDAGTGPDLYKATYARAFNMRPADVSKKQRQIGKVMELGLGYQGGVGAFLTFARGYGMNLNEFAEQVALTAPPEQLDSSRRRYVQLVQRGQQPADLPPDVWVACDYIKNSWRRAHPAITKFWADAADAAKRVLSGMTAEAIAGRVVFRRRGTYLVAVLPSGRAVCYPSARLPADAGGGAAFEFYGALPASKRWGYIRTYAGRIAENLTQATARDVLASSMAAVERAGYAIVLSVHDELITETPDEPRYKADELAALMTRAPAWADGLPLSAAGFESYRYRKD